MLFPFPKVGYVSFPEGILHHFILPPFIDWGFRLLRWQCCATDGTGSRSLWSWPWWAVATEGQLRFNVPGDLRLLRLLLLKPYWSQISDHRKAYFCKSFSVLPSRTLVRPALHQVHRWPFFRLISDSHQTSRLVSTLICLVSCGWVCQAESSWMFLVLIAGVNAFSRANQSKLPYILQCLIPPIWVI